jgi:NADH-quinone oxidoreductase subunit K
MDVPVSYYVVLSGIVFSIGLVGVLIRRNIIIILLSVELMLNATNINFVAFSSYLGNLSGQVFVFFALTVAAAEVAVGLASPSDWRLLSRCTVIRRVSILTTSGC